MGGCCIGPPPMLPAGTRRSEYTALTAISSHRSGGGADLHTSKDCDPHGCVAVLRETLAPSPVAAVGSTALTGTGPNRRAATPLHGPALVAPLAGRRGILVVSRGQARAASCPRARVV